MAIRANLGSVVGAATGASTAWVGGKTMVVTRVSSGSGNVILQFLEAVTGIWVDCAAARTANGIDYLDLAPGSYRINVAATTTAQIVLYEVDKR